MVSFLLTTNRWHRGAENKSHPGPIRSGFSRPSIWLKASVDDDDDDEEHFIQWRCSPTRTHRHTHTHTKEPTKTHTRRVLIGCWDEEKGAIKVISRPIDRFFLFDCTFWWPSKKKLENNGRCDDVIHQLSFCSKANEAPNCLTLNTSVRI